MRAFNDLPLPWQRVFELEWSSVCNGSRAIAAVITDENGSIISEARNCTGERLVPNPKTAHAENAAVAALDTAVYPELWKYRLYAGLEPCIMCMGTIVMGGIRHIEIGARDNYGGAMGLIDTFAFASSKNIEIIWRDNEFGDIQRAFQTVRELLYCSDKQKLERIIGDFSQLNACGVEAAQKLEREGMFRSRPLTELAAQEVYDRIAEAVELSR